jgi:SPP1 family predicted phage head-tail adaptor
MRAGALDQRVTLERLVEGEDAAGQPFEDWTPVFDAWAAVMPLRGREIVAADAVASITDVRVIIRYRPGITPAMRVQHGAETYSIASVANIASANREIELMCKRVA